MDDPVALLVLLGTLNYSGELFSRITPTLNNAYVNAADIIFTKQKALFFLAEEKAELYIRDRGLLLKNAPDPVIEAISKYVGKPDIALDTLAKDIKSKWSDASLNRAKLIAQTETTEAFSAGKEAAMIELGIEYKRWINMGDGNVRDEHTDEATGVVAKVGQLFKNGMMGPGGFGCRCMLDVGKKGDII